MKINISHVLIGAIITGLAGGAYCQDNKGKAREYYQKGNDYYQQGKYQEAQEEFKKALEIVSQKEESGPFRLTLPEPAGAEKTALPVQATVKSAVRSSKEYIIGDDDILHVSVWQNSDLDQEVIVRPDGRISFPLIGDIQATGLTITELDVDMTERLKEFIRHPEVSISIRKIGGQRVLILGEVVTPGIYSVKGAKTALEAVGLAGGFTRDSVPSSTVLIRGGFQKPDAKRINLSKALKGDLRENASLQPEDILFVPKKFIANLNYFLNQVIGPLAQGAYADTQLRYLQRDK